MNDTVFESIERLDRWIAESHWVGCDPFDGLSAPLARRLTFELPFLRVALQQTVRRLPVNIRPWLGITPKRSNQAMGYFVSAYLRLYKLTGQPAFLDKARYCLTDLQAHSSPGYHGQAWGWSFDYQSRGHYLPKGVPSVVWTSFVSQAFVDAYEALGRPEYLNVARSACEFILRDLPRHQLAADMGCISYVPITLLEIHNANMLAASLLARVYKHTREPELLQVAEQAVRYTMHHQRADASWYYGEGLRWRWVDGYHTGFVLDSLYGYMQGTGDDQYESHLKRGMACYREKLFQGVIPKHYDYSVDPIDIQSASQAIQTFALIPEKYHGDLEWSEKVATWTIENMQAPSGCFYFRKGRIALNKTPFLHWGQSTMLAALTLLLERRDSPRGLVTTEKGS